MFTATTHYCVQVLMSAVRPRTVLCQGDALLARTHNVHQENQLYRLKIILDTCLLCQRFFSIKQKGTTKGYTVVQGLPNAERLPGITWEILYGF